MLRKAALDEQRGAFRIDPGGEPVDDHVVDIAFDDFAIFVVRRQRVPVRDEIEAVEVGLQPYPVLQCTVVMTEMQGASGTHAGQDSLFHGQTL